jgi:tetratricopeptide (TPR) repeat protein
MFIVLPVIPLSLERLLPMDQRTSALADDLLEKSRLALQSGQADVALDYIRRARALAPLNRDVRLLFEEAKALQGRQPQSPPALTNIPPGQEPPALPPPAPLKDSGRSGWLPSFSRPDDASGHWEKALRDHPSGSLSHRGRPSAQITTSDRSSSQLRPFIPEPERRPSVSPKSGIDPLPLPIPQSSPQSEPIPFLLTAIQTVGSGLAAATAATGTAAHQAASQLRRITARGILLTGSYILCSSYAVYSVATAHHQFGIPLPIVQDTRAASVSRNPHPASSTAFNRLSFDPSLVAPTTHKSASPPESANPADQKKSKAPTSDIQASFGGTGLNTLPPLSASYDREQVTETASAPSRTMNVQALAKDAQQLLDQGQANQAIELLLAALPKVPSVSRPGFEALLARAHDLEGGRLLNLKQISEAISAYQAAVELTPKESAYHLHLGNAYYHDAQRMKDQRRQSLDRYKQGALAVEQAVKLAPKDFLAHHRLALIYEALGRTAEARKAWRNVLQHAPGTSTSAQAADRALKRLSRSG